MSIVYILMPLTGALIGWITNVWAIKLLFRPFHPIRIPLIGLSLQGLLPKRKAEIAKRIGQVVETELIDTQDLFDKIFEPESIERFSELINKTVRNRINDFLPEYVPESIRIMMHNFVGGFVSRELINAIAALKSDLGEHVASQVSIAELVEDKINSLDVVEVERLVLQVSKGELHHIEVIGGVIGFFVGVVQAIISSVL